MTHWWIGPDLGKDVAMARSIWKGALSFGLVNVPVGLYPATQDKTIHFNQFESGTSDRIRYKKVNERTGKEVRSDKIVKGVDLGGGEYVILTDDELAAAEPERSRYIDITDFVELDEIDPVYFRTTYYLAPEGESAGKAYALLHQAMRQSGKVAIATFVMRNKEYLVAIRPEGEVIALETMYFADEVRSPTVELPDLPKADDPTDREIKMAQLTDRLDGGLVGSQAVPRHPPPEGRGTHRGEEPGQRDRGEYWRAGGQGSRPHGRLKRQHQGSSSDQDAHQVGATQGIGERQEGTYKAPIRRGRRGQEGFKTCSRQAARRKAS